MQNKAHIFGQSGKPINKYQERINKVAEDICVNDPALLAERGWLLELVKDRVDESGYVYVKGNLGQKNSFSLIMRKTDLNTRRLHSKRDTTVWKA